MKFRYRFLLSLITLSAAVLVHAATAPAPVLESCPSGTYNSYASVPLASTLSVVWSSVSVGDASGQQNLKCSTVAAAGANASVWYVKYSINGGVSWLWAKLSTVQALNTVAPVTTASLSWAAPTQDANGNPLTAALTYNLYRGPTATSLVILQKGLTTTSTTDTVTVNGTYWYAVTAVANGLESTPTAAVSASLVSGVVASPAPPTSLVVK